MKKFLKKYLWIIISLIVSFALIMLSVLWVVFFIIGTVLLSITFFILAGKAKAKYDELKDFSEEDLYIDARKYDYDEDVYYIADGKNNKKGLKRGLFAKFNAKMPTVICVILGLGFLSFALMMGISLLFK